MIRYTRAGIFLFLACLGCLSACRNQAPESHQARLTLEEVRQAADSIAKKFVPDKREGICTIHMDVFKATTLIMKGETMYPEAKVELLNYIRAAGFDCMDSLQILPDTVQLPKYWGLVTISVANLRATPAEDAELVSQAILGTPVKLFKIEGDWFLIQTPDHYLGWMEESSLETINGSEFLRWKQAKRAIYLENSGWLYDSPAKREVVCDLVAGSLLEVISEEKGMIQLMLPDGRKGYSSKEHFRDLKEWQGQVSLTREGLCKESKKFLGLPYLWGGTSSKAVDCSGFVRTVYFLNGTILSRDASLQYKHGLSIDVSQDISRLEPGDLMFFGKKDSIHPKVTHVGMYLGNTEYINASGRVLINSLDSKHENYNAYHKNAFLGARRIIGTDEDPGIVRIKNHPWYNLQ